MRSCRNTCLRGACRSSSVPRGYASDSWQVHGSHDRRSNTSLPPRHGFSGRRYHVRRGRALPHGFVLHRASPPKHYVATGYPRSHKDPSPADGSSHLARTPQASLAVRPSPARR